MNRLLVAVGGFGAFVLTCGAGENYSTWYYQGTTDTRWQESSYQRANWVDPAHPDAEPVLPAVAGKCFVPANMTLYSYNGGYLDFPGTALAVAGTHISAISGYTYQTFDELRMLPGGVYRHNSRNYINAKALYVEGTEENPASFAMYQAAGNTILYNGTWYGDRQSVARITHTALAHIDRETVYGQQVKLLSDLANYYGKLIVDEENCVELNCRLSDYQTTGVLAHYPGAIEVKTNAILTSAYVSGDYIVGDMTLEPGGELNIYVQGNNSGGIVGAARYVVTNKFVANGNFALGFHYDREGCSFGYSTDVNCNKGIPFVHLTAEAVANSELDFSEARIVGFNIKAACGLPRNVRVGLIDNGDGTKDIGIVWDPVKAMILNNSSNGSSKPLAFDAGNEDCWSDGVVPGADFAGDVLICYDKALDLRAWAKYSFPQMKIYVPASTVYFQAESLTVDELHMAGGSALYTYSGAHEPTLIGKLITYPGNGDIKFDGWGTTSNAKCFKIKAEISGNGNLKLPGNDNIGNANGNLGLSLELFGTNTAFSGKICVSEKASQWNLDATPPRDLPGALYLHDGRNLGGPCETDGWRALMVENHAIVEAKDDVIVTEPTRGVYVKTAARFVVPEEKTMSFAAPITYGGELTKLGAGRLALGKAQFSATGATPIAAPTAGLNVLNVAEGSVSANDTDAFAGLAVSFAAGTSLCVDLGATDADLIATGADLRKAGTSLAVVDAALKVTFCGGSMETTDGKTVAICTVPAAMAQTLKLDAAHKAETATGRMSVSVTSKTNDDGSVTYLATAFKGGVLLIVR